MPASYLSLSSPIKRETNTYVDQDGVKFSSMLITSTAVCAPSLVPAVGSTYEMDSNLWVTQSDLTYSPDGLGKITVTAAGPSSNAKPRVRIIPGAPRIFGLSPNPNAERLPPAFHPSAGVTVEVTFVAIESEIQNIVGTYLRKVIPSSILGLSLPQPARGPGSLDSDPVSGGSGVPVYQFIGRYGGFICISIRTESRGKAMVVVLSYQEAGELQSRQANNSYELLFNYNP